jgi:hypothetical protein
MRSRHASIDDTAAIAVLHAESWRIAYRGALQDEFLDGDVFADRETQWAQRLSAPPENQLARWDPTPSTNTGESVARVRKRRAPKRRKTSVTGPGTETDRNGNPQWTKAEP